MRFCYSSLILQIFVKLASLLLVSVPQMKLDRLSALKNLKQKKLGLILIGLGVFLFLFITLFIYFKVLRVAGFAQLLPADTTVAFVEFPTALDKEMSANINKLLRVDWNKEIVPWAGEKAAFAFLKGKALMPLLLIQTTSPEKANEFLSRNKKV